MLVHRRREQTHNQHEDCKNPGTLATNTGFWNDPSEGLLCCFQRYISRKTCAQAIPHPKLRKNTEKDLFTVFLPSLFPENLVSGRFFTILGEVQLVYTFFQIYTFKNSTISPRWGHSKTPCSSRELFFLPPRASRAFLSCKARVPESVPQYIPFL